MNNPIKALPEEIWENIFNPGSALAQRSPSYEYMHPSWGGMMSGMGWIGLIFHLLILLLLLVAMILIVKWLLQSTRSEKHRESSKTPGRALDILKERYAKGEIDRKEYEQKKQDLS